MTTFSTTIQKATTSEIRRVYRDSRRAVWRTMGQFALDEIIIPDGPFKGLKYRYDRQPFSRLWFEEIDSKRYQRFAAVGPTQSGKTLTCCVIPTMYHLFELEETVIFGLPSMDMAKDKWLIDLLPAIEASRYRHLLPAFGSGSKGGKIESIQFKNGAVLKFMSGGGSDKKRSAFTSRVLVVTEVDGMDEASGTSREADKITQMEARTLAYQASMRGPAIYLECTASIEEGRIWKEYTNGTKSRIALHCKCGAYVTPDRDHLLGWQSAENEIEAYEKSRFYCPSCAEAWTNEERLQFNVDSILLHEGQEAGGDGEITGEAKQTDTLGFRWSAVNNMLALPGTIGRDEWNAKRDENEEMAERKMCQFIWALPAKPTVSDMIPLDPNEVKRRVGHGLHLGVVPDWADCITVGCDVGAHLLHWVVVAWQLDGTSHVVEYGVVDVHSKEMGEPRAIANALSVLRERCQQGWKYRERDGDCRPIVHIIDSGYQPAPVYACVREFGQPDWFPAKGYGQTQEKMKNYTARHNTSGKQVILAGDEYHVSQLDNDAVGLLHFNSDHWKSFVHDRLRQSREEPGAMTLFEAMSSTQHWALAKHLTAEKKTSEFVQGKGDVVKWVKTNRNNHWLDAMAMAAVGGHTAGVRLVKNIQPKENGGDDGESEDTTKG